MQHILEPGDSQTIKQFLLKLERGEENVGKRARAVLLFLYFRYK
jgi:hypothetical protein